MGSGGESPVRAAYVSPEARAMAGTRERAPSECAATSHIPRGSKARRETGEVWEGRARAEGEGEGEDGVGSGVRVRVGGVVESAAAASGCVDTPPTAYAVVVVVGVWDRIGLHWNNGAENADIGER